MRKILIPLIAATVMIKCSEYESKHAVSKSEDMNTKIDSSLPTVGVLIFEEFLTNEVVAPLDVFTKYDMEGQKLFNVVLVAREHKPYVSEEGLKVLPDFTIADTPDLDVLVVPSSNNPDKQITDKELIDFIRQQSQKTDYLASHCAGAFMLGEAGVADDKRIVTYPSSQDALSSSYPSLLVQDDDVVDVVHDGNIISSNGNLVSYKASLELLELMTNKAHRQKVEEDLLLNRLTYVENE